MTNADSKAFRRIERIGRTKVFIKERVMLDKNPQFLIIRIIHPGNNIFPVVRFRFRQALLCPFLGGHFFSASKVYWSVHVAILLVW